MLLAPGGITFLQIKPVHFDAKTHFLDPQAEAKTPMLATVSPQVRHFSYCFATSVSFYPLSHPTCVILATLSPHQSPQHTHNMLQLPLLLPFLQHLQPFSPFFSKILPAPCGDHVFASQSDAFWLQQPTFWTSRRRQKHRCWQLFRSKCVILATLRSGLTTVWLAGALFETNRCDASKCGLGGGEKRKC